MTPRVYIAGFDVFSQRRVRHGRGYIADNFGLSGNLMQACTGQIVVGDVSAWHDASRTSTNRTKVPLAFEN